MDGVDSVFTEVVASLAIGVVMDGVDSVFL
jgi:hypothetical protein